MTTCKVTCGSSPTRSISAANFSTAIFFTTKKTAPNKKIQPLRFTDAGDFIVSADCLQLVFKRLIFTEMAMDTWYVRNWSVWIDLMYLFKTVKAVLQSRGAY